MPMHWLVCSRNSSSLSVIHGSSDVIESLVVELAYFCVLLFVQRVFLHILSGLESISL